MTSKLCSKSKKNMQKHIGKTFHCLYDTYLPIWPENVDMPYLVCLINSNEIVTATDILGLNNGPSHDEAGYEYMNYLGRGVLLGFVDYYKIIPDVSYFSKSKWFRCNRRKHYGWKKSYTNKLKRHLIGL